jgi:hypothetical protein
MQCESRGLRGLRLISEEIISQKGYGCARAGTFESLVELPASLARQAKVAKLSNAIHNKDIVRLDVTMNEPLRVHKSALHISEFRLSRVRGL